MGINFCPANEMERFHLNTTFAVDMFVGLENKRYNTFSPKFSFANRIASATMNIDFPDPHGPRRTNFFSFKMCL